MGRRAPARRSALGRAAPERESDAMAAADDAHDLPTSAPTSASRDQDDAVTITPEPPAGGLVRGATALAEQGLGESSVDYLAVS